MKIKSKINVSNINKELFIETIEQYNLEITDKSKLLFKNTLPTYAHRGYLYRRPILNGKYESNHWIIKVDSIIFKSILLSIASYVFLWYHNTEIIIRIITSFMFFLINYFINRKVIKTQIDKIENTFEKKRNGNNS